MAYGDFTVRELRKRNSTLRRILTETDPILLAVLGRTFRRLTPEQRLNLHRRLADDLEDARGDPGVGVEQVSAGPPPPKGASPRDVRPHLDTLAIRWSQVVDPNHGYSGTYRPEEGGTFLHWTASAAGSNVAASVLAERHYHYCAGRDGIAYLGGWNVRQGHGGEGRTGPQGVARAGSMTLEQIKSWQASGAGDDTSNGANDRFVGVCLDNNGTGEQPPSEQWRAFTGLAAASLHAQGKTRGNLLDHAASTNRKIDLGTFTDRYWSDVEVQLQLLEGGPGNVTTAVGIASTPAGDGYHILVSDGGVFQYGSAVAKGSAFGKLGSPVVAIAAHPQRNDGYLVLEANGGVHAFGSCQFKGSAYETLNPS